jgi:hypothetical protein
LKEWTTLDSRNTPSATNLEEEEIVKAPGSDGNASMPEQVKRPNPWRKKKMMMMNMPKSTLRTSNSALPLENGRKIGLIYCTNNVFSTCD